MTIDQLIERLKEYPGDTKVITWDPDQEKAVGITGFLYDPKDGVLDLCTDDTE